MLPVTQTDIPKVTVTPAVITPMATFIENGSASAIRASSWYSVCASFIESRLRLGHPSKLMVLGLHFCCAYSAHCLCEGYTWGVAPGFILLRLQRAMLARVFQLHPRWPRKMKRPTFSSLMTAPGNVKIGLHDFCDCHWRVASHRQCAWSAFCFVPFCLFTFQSLSRLDIGQEYSDNAQQG